MSADSSDPKTLADLLGRRSRWRDAIGYCEAHGLRARAVRELAERDVSEGEAAIRGAFRECPSRLPLVVSWEGKLLVYVSGNASESGLREVIPVKAEDVPLR